jgi:[acyl-carrier-protein] S-malonyltransferase
MNLSSIAQLAIHPQAGLAFVFPGQGAQSVGMLNALADPAFAQSAIVAECLAVADKALGEPISQMIANGPAEDLGLTVNTQPAMLLAAYSAFAAWRAAGGPMPAVMAGHSLGEYTALVAAKTFALSDAIRLVRLRAQAMQSAVPVGTGAMAAILGLDDATVKAVCLASALSEVVEPANFNAPAQVVIAGHKAAVDRACEAAKAAGAKRALLLPVSAPFHSSLLKPAGAVLNVALNELLAKGLLSASVVPVINNVDVAMQALPSAIVDALVRQSYGAVRWVELVNQMSAMGIKQVVEFGPGKVLCGLIQRIDKTMTLHSVSDPASLASALAAVQS